MQTVELCKLSVSPQNVRSMRDSVDSLKASILAVGLLNPLSAVAKKGKRNEFEVVAGGRRLKALKELQTEGKVAKNYTVAINVIDSNTSLEVSLMENVHREKMHPYDEFVAFNALIGEGKSIAEIATRNGVTEHMVKQRLKLGAVSPAILNHFKENKVSLEQLMAYALTDDHSLQEAIYMGAQSEWQRSASEIKSKIVTDEIKADDSAVVFLGIDNYLAAGGTLRQDLFSENHEGDSLLDKALFLKLFNDKMLHEAEKIQAEGWGWVEFNINFDYNYCDQFQRFYSSVRDMNEAEQKTYDNYSQAIDDYDAQLEAIEQRLADDEADEVDLTLIKAINAGKDCTFAQIKALEDGLKYWDERQVSAGVYFYIGNDGCIKRREGLIKASDFAKNEVTEPNKNISKDTISDALKNTLMAERTGAMQVLIAENTNKAMQLLAFKMASNYFYHSYNSFKSCVQNNGEQPNFSVINDLECRLFYQKQQVQEANIKANLPTDELALWDCIIALPAQTVLDIIAFCTSRQVSFMSTSHNEAYQLFGQYFGLDMHNFWQATADNYFNRCTREHIIGVAKSIVGKHPPNTVLT